MSTREVIRRGESGGVPFHDHDASEISGKFDFLRILQAIIDGDLTVSGFLRTALAGNRVEIRPADSSSVSSAQWFDANGNAGAIEMEDQGSGVWALKFFGPNTGSGAGYIKLRDDGLVVLDSDDSSAYVAVVKDLHVADGDAASPGVRRDASADGIFLGSGFVGLGIGGSEVARADAGGLVFTVDGSAANPAIARSATEDGVFFASGAVGVAIGGSEVARFGTGFIGPWTTWTPSYTNITVGTGGGAGTVVARYCKIGSTVHGYFKFTLGSGSAIGGAVSISTPVTASSNYGTATGSPIIGSAFFTDTTDSTNNAVGIARLYPDEDTMHIQVLNTSGTYSNEDNIGSTVPFTWASADWLGFSFTYEAA